MNRRLKNLFLILAATPVLIGCSSNTIATTARARQFPATDEGATELLKEFVKTDTDYVALSRQLRPTSADYEAVFQPGFGTGAALAYNRAWDAGQMIVTPNNPARTEVRLFSATSEELRNRTGMAAKFAEGWSKVAPHLRPRVKIYQVDFIEPGKAEGMKYDGLVNVNGNWRIFPRPWQTLDQQTAVHRGTGGNNEIRK